jgi:DNA polymerase-3 subunit chi
MGSVTFHTGVSDKLAYTCRLVRKIWRSGQRVVVTGSPDQLARLDALLWTFEKQEFLPHARLRAGQPLAAHLSRTPVVLADIAAEAGQAEVLVNLGPLSVPGCAGFARVNEVVADSADEVQNGRVRWRACVSAGLAPVNHAVGTA